MMYSRRLFAVVLLTTIGFHAAGALASRPNVLLIVSEDNGPELSCYGDPYAQTPNLDRLAAEGVRFNRAFVAQAGCSQSRAAYLTGLYPHQNGQIGLATWDFRMYREDTPNIPRSLKAAGYRTGIIGKLHINPESAFPFDYARNPSRPISPARTSAIMPGMPRHLFAPTTGRSSSASTTPTRTAPGCDRWTACPRIRSEPDDVQAFAYLGIDPPPMRESIANHYNCMSRLDSLVGDLLAALERSGKADNTLVIYFGDHGADLLRGKRTSYEGGVRIPLIVRWPRQAKRARFARNWSRLST